VYPTAVVPTFFANIAAMSGSAATSRAPHGGQKIHAQAHPAGGKLSTVATVTGLYDIIKMAQASPPGRPIQGELLFETEWSVIYRGEGGFGGSRPPENVKVTPPARPSDFRVEETTSETQALLYRLSGDLNPLHADPAIGQLAGFGKPILHGLCTYGFLGRRWSSLCGGDG
jgi:hypothetical protein